MMTGWCGSGGVQVSLSDFGPADGTCFGVTLLLLKLCLCQQSYLPLDLPSGRTVMLESSCREQNLLITFGCIRLHNWSENQQQEHRRDLRCVSGNATEFRQFDWALLINIPWVILIAPCFLSTAAHPLPEKDKSAEECAVSILWKRVEQQCMICPQRYYSLSEFAEDQYLDMFSIPAPFYPEVQIQPACPK